MIFILLKLADWASIRASFFFFSAKLCSIFCFDISCCFVNSIVSISFICWMDSIKELMFLFLICISSFVVAIFVKTSFNFVSIVSFVVFCSCIFFVCCNNFVLLVSILAMHVFFCSCKCWISLFIVSVFLFSNFNSSWILRNVEKTSIVAVVSKCNLSFLSLIVAILRSISLVKSRVFWLNSISFTFHWFLFSLIVLCPFSISIFNKFLFSCSISPNNKVCFFLEAISIITGCCKYLSDCLFLIAVISDSNTCSWLSIIVFIHSMVGNSYCSSSCSLFEYFAYFFSIFLISRRTWSLDCMKRLNVLSNFSSLLVVSSIDKLCFWILFSIKEAFPFFDSICCFIFFTCSCNCWICNRVYFLVRWTKGKNSRPFFWQCNSFWMSSSSFNNKFVSFCIFSKSIDSISNSFVLISCKCSNSVIRTISCLLAVVISWCRFSMRSYVLLARNKCAWVSNLSVVSFVFVVFWFHWSCNCCCFTVRFVWIVFISCCLNCKMSVRKDWIAVCTVSSCSDNSFDLFSSISCNTNCFCWKCASSIVFCFDFVLAATTCLDRSWLLVTISCVSNWDSDNVFESSLDCKANCFRNVFIQLDNNLVVEILSMLDCCIRLFNLVIVYSCKM